MPNPMPSPRRSDFVAPSATLALLLALAAPPSAHADGSPAFSVRASDGATTTLSATANSFPEIAQDLIKNRGTFEPLLSANTFSGQIDFLGISDAIKINMTTPTPGTASATIQLLDWDPIPFTGNSRDEIFEQAKEYFTKNGSEIYGRFMREIARQSFVAVTDGNPRSSTALMANDSFAFQGWTPIGAIPNLLLPEATPAASGVPGVAAESVGASALPSSTTTGTNSLDRMKTLGFAVGLNAGRFEAGDFKGSYMDGALPWNLDITRRVSFAGSLSANYLEMDGAQVFGAGLTLAVPVKILEITPASDWNWRLSPHVGFSARGSYDLAAAGAIVSGGFTSALEYRAGKDWLLSLANQITYHESLSIPLPSHYEFDIEVRQYILKNGLRATYRILPKLHVSAFVIETNFLRDAAIGDYTTLGGALTWSFTDTIALGVAGNYDFGKDYNSYSVGVVSTWKF